MCGIVAIFSRQAPVAADVLERATKSLRHRGPDGQRYWIASDGRVGLGHARLSIIDLTTGAQPIANEDDTYRIIVTGGFCGHQIRTLYEGNYQIPPEHYMLATDKHVQINQYWDFNYPRTADAGPQRSDDEYAEEFRQAFDKAVRLRLRADVPVGCYLS